jgi:hypothetical protein
LRNIACCVAMNDEEEVTIFEAMIQWILKLTLQQLLIHAYLSKSILYLNVTFSTALSVNTSSNVFSTSVSPRHLMQSWGQGRKSEVVCNHSWETLVILWKVKLTAF